MAKLGSAIEIKQRKLREELQKEKPNKLIVRRYKESISRHKKEMACVNKIKSRKKMARVKK